MSTTAQALDMAQEAAKVLLGAAVATEAREASMPYSWLTVSSLLLGRGSTMLPASSTFEPLLPRATNVILSGAAAKKLSTHTTYELPGEHVGEPQLFDVVHRFTVQRRVALALNERLTKLAERKHQLATRCEMRPVHTPPGPGSNAGMVMTNKGGYQSYHDLFEDSAPKACRELRDLVSVALSEIVALEIDATGQSSSYAGDEAFLQPGLGELHASYAWLNVNRPSDWNSVHQHDVERWSAVYFVSDGEPNAPGFPCPESGHMIFRCGPKPLPAQLHGGINTTTSSSGACSHSFMSVAPLPGTMWIFPGSVPHAVMHTVLPSGVNEPEQPRISIGINFQDARSPPPRAATCSVPKLQ